MKRSAIAVVLVLLLFAVASQAQTPAPKPGPEHKKLEIWVGDWTWEAESKATPLGPAGKFTAKASVRPILGGFFVEWRAEEKGPEGTIQWYFIDGYDPVTKRYTSNRFASDGTVQTFTYTIEGIAVAYSGTEVAGGKQAKFRGAIIFTPSFMSNVEKREMSVDGKAWMPFAEIKLTKVKSLSK